MDPPPFQSGRITEQLQAQDVVSPAGAVQTESRAVPLRVTGLFMRSLGEVIATLLTVLFVPALYVAWYRVRPGT